MLPGMISEWHWLSVDRDNEKVHVIKLPDYDGLVPLFFESREDFQVTSVCFSHDILPIVSSQTRQGAALSLSVMLWMGLLFM